MSALLSIDDSLDNSTANSTDTSASKRERALGKILCEAASEGDLEHIKQLVESNASVDTCDYDKRYAMHLAAAEGHLEVVRYLISQNGNVNVKDRWGGYPLKDAAVGGHTAVRDLLLQHGAKIDESDQLALAQQLCGMAAKGELEGVKGLIECRVSVNASLYDQRTALHLAAAEGQYDVVQYLLGMQADVNAKDRWGGDALKDAMRGNHRKVTELLKEAGALGLSDEHSDHGMTMGERMCKAASRGDLEEIKSLVAKNASVNACDYDRRSALHLAAAEGHHEVVAFLVIYGANVNCTDRWGGDPLKDAIRGGHSQVQTILRNAGGRGEQDDHSDHKDHGDRMCNAAAKGDVAQIKNLVAKGASVNACDYDRRSALHLAAAEGHDKVVEFLIQCGANVMCVDRWGASPLKDAVRGGHTRVQQLLFDAGACMENKIEAVKAQVEAESYRAKPLSIRARAEKWNVNREEVKMGKLLGEGQQGYVLRADWRGMPVVCKVLKNRESMTDDLDFQNEIQVLSQLRHPNLVLFLGACLEGEPKIILSEYLDGGSLEDEYEKKRAEKSAPWRPSVVVVHRWALELAMALCFLHGCQPPVIHRDLKPGNLLLTAEGHLKVSDFGLSKIFDANSSDGTYKMTGVTGTLRYMAPEVMRSESYTEKVDVYSYAFVLWFMCTGERPLMGKVQQDFLDAATRHFDLRPDLEEISYKPLAGLMASAWNGHADQRPTAAELVARLRAMQLPTNLKEKACKKKSGAKSCAVS